MEEDKLGKLERQNEDLRRMVARIKAARGPPGELPFCTHAHTHTQREREREGERRRAGGRARELERERARQ